MQEVSRQVGSVAGRILRGDPMGDIKTSTIGFGPPRFDWREMQRWGISEASLPAGSVAGFRVPTLFEQYRWYIIAATALFAIQAILIAVLIVNRTRLQRANVKRRRAEDAALELSRRLISAQEDERSRLARELHDDVTQRFCT